MPEYKVNISEGPPITATPPDQLERQGAIDGAAAKAASLGAALDPATLVPASKIMQIAKRFAVEVALVAQLTVMRHHKAVGEANATVVTASNQLALSTEALVAGEQELAEAKEQHGGFLQRIVEVFDRPLDLSNPADTGAPEIGDDFGVAGTKDAGGGSDGNRDLGDEAAGDEPQALRFAWRRDLPAWVVWLVLAVITGAEFALSARAFQSIREQEVFVLLLAGLVGSAMVALAHRIGTNLGHLLEQPLRAKGRSPAKLVETAFEIPALFIGIVGVATVRSSYFRIVHIAIPTAGLVCLQLMLAAAAVGVTMAGHSVAADEIRDRARRVEDVTYAVRKLRKPFLEAQQVLVQAEGALRYAIQEFVTDYEIQVSHVSRSMMDYYLRAFSEAAGVHVIGPLPEVAPPALVAQAVAWLMAHPVGTLAHFEFPYSSAAGAQGDAAGEHEDDAEDQVQEPDPQGVFGFADLNEEEAA